MIPAPKRGIPIADKDGQAEPRFTGWMEAISTAVSNLQDAITGFLKKDQNLADLEDAPTARTNLGLKSAATADILGTVSESSGTPTGSIFEEGSNANGHYMRFASGMQICTFRVITSTSGDGIWTFPKAFAANPRVTISLDTAATGVFAVTTRPGTISTESVDYAGYDSGGRVGVGAIVVAYGVWFA